MPGKIEFGCLPTIIGSMPQVDATEACLQIVKYLPDIPAWPQLPARSSLENMYVQYSEGFPGIAVVDTRVYVDRSRDFDSQLEKLYNAASENNPDDYGVSADYASGLYAFLALREQHPQMVKGQITGPISWGLCVTDRNQRGILYDEQLAEATASFIRLKAFWQERFLQQMTRDTLIFLDEPYLASLGSAFVAISNEQVANLLEESLASLQGWKGIHCCGGTDWSLLLKSSIDVLSFDTYNYADSFSCYPAEVHTFLQRGGTVAWGIVSNEEEMIGKETLSSLYDRLGEAISPFTRDGFSIKKLVSQSLITPSCSLASMSIDAAEHVLQLLSGLSRKMRGKYLS